MTISERALDDWADRWDEVHPRYLELIRSAEAELGRDATGSATGNQEILTRRKANLDAGRPWWQGIGTPGQHVVYQLSAAHREGCRDLGTVYIGVTSHLSRRLETHSRRLWWPLVHPLGAEFHVMPTRRAAEELEALMIHAEQPLANRAGRELVVRYLDVAR